MTSPIATLSLSVAAFALSMSPLLPETAANGQEVQETGAPDQSRYAATPIDIPSPIDSENAEVTYPRAVSIQEKQLFVVDLDLPGIWTKTLGEDDSKSVFTPGTKLLRKPMNRPWGVVAHPAGGLLIGDSATREIYHAKEPGVKLVALNGGYLGIPMALAVDKAGETIYVGDAERRAVFRLPIAGGKPELVARVNARGLSFDADGALWAITPDADAVIKIDVQSGEAVTVVGDRPYQFPNGLVWTGDEGFVTDGYGKSIWRFTADGKTEKWFEGEPLQGPVGLTADHEAIYVADPRSQQVFRFDRKSKAVEPTL